MDVKNGAIKAYQDGGSSVLETDFGLQIPFASTLYVQVIVPTGFSGATSGLCGNYNGDATLWQPLLLWKSGSGSCVRKDSGTEKQPDLELEVSTSGSVRVRPSAADSDKLCGACGNYNGLASDDLAEDKAWIMSVNSW
ncbi:hypothetical protein SKAU_G00418250 [Synaphobranchus kaupii]|uniref:VWFD domain-containing protein n=1 Tax=Synaphobranchus kaupii TaxID=118154 RepID=A0A9Q1IAV9_SYNKA|nr:hypothetical protein SKAU_G00418230 [Synaphobranchus kaupii]KAJ8332929.1 hypothetical protein SKAU_G00418250 [Synaphobranchus kaupii]